MTKNSPADETNITPGQNPPPVGPTDHGGKGGMATRELAPEISEPDVAETAD